MTLVDIMTDLLSSTGRTTRRLQRGLWLIYYPPQNDPDGVHRLIAARRHTEPSETELQIVRKTLLQALDRHPSRLVTKLASEWRKTKDIDWNGYVITFHLLSPADAFSKDPQRARQVRIAIDQRAQRTRKNGRKSSRARA
jgi:hypothetical protein